MSGVSKERAGANGGPAGSAHPNSRLLHDLGERVKELTALYRTAELLRREDRPIAAWVRELAELLPPAWQYPEVTAGRVRMGEVEYATPGFRSTAWVQRAEFVTGDGEAGLIEVAYLEARPPETEGPFLAEERKLIDGLAEMLRSAVIRRRAQESLAASERQARRLLHERGERVKELTALYRTAHVLQHEDASLEEWLERIALLLPAAWQYPEIAAGRVRLGDLDAKGPGYRATRWSQRREFETEDGTKGLIEVVYLEERPADAEGPFLAEERALINGLAEMLRSAVMRRAARERLRTSAERIRNLAGRLIVAQESERARIARDLHDDLSQRLAALSLGLSGLKRRIPAEHADELHSVQRLAMDLAQELRVLSHRLHPSVLQHTGLAPALGALCEEAGRGDAGTSVAFRAESELPEMPSDLVLCLYRVAQESLRNTMRHAGAKTARVAVSAADGVVTLTVIDDGRGFDVAAARSGMGLMSMEERVRLVKGSVRVETRPGSGTEIRVEVPIG